MLSLRCRLLQYVVFVSINGCMATTFFSRYFLFHFPNKSVLSLPCLFSPLTMYNKTIIGFGFCGMQIYQCLGKSYLPRLRLGWTLIIPHITKTSSNNCLLLYKSKSLSIGVSRGYRHFCIVLITEFMKSYFSNEKMHIKCWLDDSIFHVNSVKCEC